MVWEHKNERVTVLIHHLLIEVKHVAVQQQNQDHAKKRNAQSMEVYLNGQHTVHARIHAVMVHNYVHVHVPALHPNMVVKNALGH